MKPKSRTIEDNAATFVYDDSPNNVGQMLEDLFKQEGYKLESGNNLQGLYGKGNDIMQLLFGAFVKRFKFPFEITASAGNAQLTIKNGTGSKVFGGAIGVSRHKKEFKRIVSLLVGEEVE